MLIGRTGLLRRSRCGGERRRDSRPPKGWIGKGRRYSVRKERERRSRSWFGRLHRRLGRCFSFFFGFADHGERASSGVNHGGDSSGSINGVMLLRRSNFKSPATLDGERVPRLHERLVEMLATAKARHFFRWPSKIFKYKFKIALVKIHT